jgi:hypothetical protein
MTAALGDQAASARPVVAQQIDDAAGPQQVDLAG